MAIFNCNVPDVLDVFDYKRFLDDGALVVGGKGTGKSTLAQLLVSRLNKEYRVRAIDVSQVWDASPLQWRYVAENFAFLPTFPNLNVIYDLSRLYIDQMTELISNLIRREYEYNIKLSDSGKDKQQIIYVFEEAEIYLKPRLLRSNAGREFLRLVCVGRNNRMAYLAVSQKPQLIDNDLWELCGQMFFGRFQRTDFLRKVLGDYAGETKGLKVGNWLYSCDGVCRKVRSERFRGRETKVINEVIKRWK